MFTLGARLFSTCAFLLCVVGSVKAQPVLNGSFEEWGDYDPVGWTTANEPTLYLPVTRSEKAIDGKYSVHIQVLDSTDQRLAPFTFVGTNDNFGFPITGKPIALEGYISTRFNKGDFVNILAFMVRKGSLIGSGSLTITADHPEFIRFSIPLEYFGDVEPDVGRIAFVLEEPPSVIGSEVWVDGLEYIPGPSSVKDPIQGDFALAYSPAGITISFTSRAPEFSTLEVLDVHGRVMQTLFAGVADRQVIRWSGGGLANGVYFIRLARPGGVVMQKAVLSR